MRQSDRPAHEAVTEHVAGLAAQQPTPPAEVETLAASPAIDQNAVTPPPDEPLGTATVAARGPATVRRFDDFELQKKSPGAAWAWCSRPGKSACGGPWPSR